MFRSPVLCCPCCFCFLFVSRSDVQCFHCERAREREEEKRGKGSHAWKKRQSGKKITEKRPQNFAHFTASSSLDLSSRALTPFLRRLLRGPRSLARPTEETHAASEREKSKWREQSQEGARWMISRRRRRRRWRRRRRQRESEQRESEQQQQQFIRLRPSRSLPRPSRFTDSPPGRPSWMMTKMKPMPTTRGRSTTPTTTTTPTPRPPPPRPPSSSGQGRPPASRRASPGPPSPPLPPLPQQQRQQPRRTTGGPGRGSGSELHTADERQREEERDEEGAEDKKTFCIKRKMFFAFSKRDLPHSSFRNAQAKHANCCLFVPFCKSSHCQK